MSMGMSMFFVPKSDFFSVIGCGSEELSEHICDQMEPDIESRDEEWEDDLEGASFGDLIEQLVMGLPLELAPDLAFLYTYAFEIICTYLGERLDNGHCSSVRDPTAYLDELDRKLAAGGVGLSFEAMLKKPFPKGLPPDGVDLGYWTAEEMRPSLEAMRKLTAAASGEDREVFEAIESWLNKSAEAPDHLVVGFLY